MNNDKKDHVNFRLPEQLLNEMKEIKEEETMTAALERAMEMMIEDEKKDTN